MDDSESLLEFPCTFPIKAMGQPPDFEALVVAIVERHAPHDVLGVSVRESRAGRYLAVTVRIRAHSRAQLDAIYQDLSDHERVVMAL